MTPTCAPVKRLRRRPSRRRHRPDFLTRQLAVLYDGASSRADDLRGLAVATPGTLLDAAGVTD
ncbi:MULTISPECIES: hypothetical protein [unclassified Amycolatopsis]|uniref:hypothetical protein n=1 Tax=unclassified Amycolatopsis TaxID=2618356 RepID=UPI001C696FA9|nr:hypothetical protein [Amycolatopsis sp. DSM 110486]QYN21366.1 hypothetical protein K1T34_02020 [Amycolatopsis sp. DSM 110486]